MSAGGRGGGSSSGGWGALRDTLVTGVMGSDGSSSRGDRQEGAIVSSGGAVGECSSTMELSFVDELLDNNPCSSSSKSIDNIMGVCIVFCNKKAKCFKGTILEISKAYRLSFSSLKVLDEKQVFRKIMLQTEHTIMDICRLFFL